MTVTGPFQSSVVKKVIVCFAIANYFYVVCHLSHLTATNNKSNSNVNLVVCCIEENSSDMIIVCRLN